MLILPASIQLAYMRWLKKRLPKARQQTLNQRRLFIFPTRQGFYFLAVCGLVLVAAVNYQNNLAYIVVFFMLSLFNTAILFTFNNVSGIALSAADSEAGFVGEHVGFKIKLSQTSARTHQQFNVYFKHEAKVQSSLLKQQSELIELLFSVTKRGWVDAPRLCVESVYPLGLIRCWTWIDLDMQALAFPMPIACDTGNLFGAADEGELHSNMHGDDFHGLRSYSPGDPLTQAYWPSLAKGLKLQQKQYLSFVSQEHWLDFDAFHQGNIEETLSKLCFAAIELQHKNEAFGLILSNTKIALSSGDKHLHTVLSALAEY